LSTAGTEPIVLPDEEERPLFIARITPPRARIAATSLQPSLAPGFSSLLGEFQLTDRYRGMARYPIRPQSGSEGSYYHLGALNLSWDPNRVK